MTYVDTDRKPSTSPDVTGATAGMLDAETALAQIGTWTDLSDTRRRDLASAVRIVAKMCKQHERQRTGRQDTEGRGADEAPVLMECQYLNERLFSRGLAVYRTDQKRMENVLSCVRYVLRRLGRHARDERKIDPASPWSPLLERIDDPFRRFGLLGIVRFCASRGIEPTAPPQSTLDDYEGWCKANLLGRDVASKGRRAMANWNWACDHVPGWPKMRLIRVGAREPYARPLTDYPPSFQEDVERFVKRISCSDLDAIFAEDPFDIASGVTNQPRRAARPKTVDTRVFQIRQAAGALVKLGHAPDSMTLLRCLVDPLQNAKTIIAFFWQRQNAGVMNPVEWKGGSQVAGVAECLRQIARFHCGLPAEQVDRIAAWARRVAPGRTGGMTPKNRARLRELIEPRARARLLHLPSRLMKQADDMLQAGKADTATSRSAHLERQAGLFALSAVAIETLLVCPMRRSNLAGLRLNRHLQRIGTNGKLITHIIIAADETKNDNAIEWPIPLESAKLIETYLRRFRPVLAAAENAFLFPGQGAKARSDSALTAAIHDPIASDVGCEVNPHLLRHFAAWLHLNRHPGQYEIVRRILNHKSVETTVSFYVGLEADAAAKHFDAVVLKERQATRGLASASFAGRRRRPKGASFAPSGRAP